MTSGFLFGELRVPQVFIEIAKKLRLPATETNSFRRHFGVKLLENFVYVDENRPK